MEKMGVPEAIRTTLASTEFTGAAEKLKAEGVSVTELQAEVGKHLEAVEAKIVSTSGKKQDAANNAKEKKAGIDKKLATLGEELKKMQTPPTDKMGNPIPRKVGMLKNLFNIFTLSGELGKEADISLLERQGQKIQPKLDKLQKELDGKLETLTKTQTNTKIIQIQTDELHAKFDQAFVELVKDSFAKEQKNLDNQVARTSKKVDAAQQTLKEIGAKGLHNEAEAQRVEQVTTNAQIKAAVFARAGVGMPATGQAAPVAPKLNLEGVTTENLSSDPVGKINLKKVYEPKSETG